MNPETLHKNLLQAIENKIPKENNIANILMDILLIGKEAVYRRLRGEVFFTLQEAVTIAKKLNISLDNTLGSLSDKGIPFQLRFLEHFDSKEPDFILLEQLIHILQTAKDDPDSEIGISQNIFPYAFYPEYEYLTRFYLLKWYYYKGASFTKPFCEIKPSKKLLELQNGILTGLRNIKKIYYIWDYMIFHYLINDIKYFTNTCLISKDELSLLKSDLLRFLNDWEDIATRGFFTPGNKIYFYISDINFQSTYAYIKANDHRISLLRAFFLNYVTSFDLKIFSKVQRWIQSLQKTSTLISETGETERTRFFKGQRKMLKNL
ncbi:MAG: hypothetical protein LBQ84_03600 [Flavobacteriaceae bacterium]|nr:hypothetical protein [Flavobacteriaceae bacterium]